MVHESLTIYYKHETILFMFVYKHNHCKCGGTVFPKFKTVFPKILYFQWSIVYHPWEPDASRTPTHPHPKTKLTQRPPPLHPKPLERFQTLGLSNDSRLQILISLYLWVRPRYGNKAPLRFKSTPPVISVAWMMLIAPRSTL